MSKRIAVVGVPGGWSSEYLTDVFGELTGFRLLVDPSHVMIDLAAGKAWCGDTELTALDALVVKKVGPAYSPMLLDRLDMLQFIADRGVRVFSRPDRIGRVINRLSCTVQLAAAGIPMPPTVVTENVDRAMEAIEAFGRVVLKPLFTSKARGMRVVEAGPGARAVVEDYLAAGNTIIYIQKMLELPGQDLGLTFLGGEYLGTYARVGSKDSWNTTTASGGRYRCHEPEADLIALAQKAQAPFGLDFTCVDVAETADGPVVFEISAFGGFHGLREGCDLDAARAYAGFVLKELGR